MKHTVTAFIFYNDKLLIVYHKRLKMWMHVGGHVEEGETLVNALFREIKEEVGLDVRLINTPFYIQKDKDTISIDYVCIASTDKVKLQKTELQEFRWVTKDELARVKTLSLFKELALKAFEVVEGSRDK